MLGYVIGGAVVVLLLFIFASRVVPSFMRDHINRFRGRRRRLARRFDQVRYSRFAYRWDAKWRIKNVLKVLIDEFASFLFHFMMNSAVAATTISVVVSAIVIAVFFEDQGELLTTTIANVILALLAIFITAAVFMGTLSRQAFDRQNKKDAEMEKQLRKNGSVLHSIFKELIDTSIDGYHKYTLLAGYAAGTVFSQDSYKRFHKEVRKHVSSFMSSYEFLQYSHSIYQITMSATGYRYDSVSRAMDIWVEKSPSLQGKDIKINDEKFKALYEACRQYEAEFTPETYSQSILLGLQLTRVVIYGVLGASASVLYSFNERYLSEVPGPFLSVNIFTLVLSFFGLVLSLRYLLMLLGYFRSIANGSDTRRKYRWWNEGDMNDSLFYE